MPITLVEGWTGPIRMVASDANGRANLEGASVLLRLYDNAHEEILEAGDTSVDIAISGEVVFLPSGTDFVAADSPYYARLEADQADGTKVYFPSDDPDVWTVRGVGP